MLMELPTIAIIGPTCCRKTEVSLRLAARLQCEIISVDSTMVYRGLDVGAAKPSLAERRQTPHHLISIRDPANAYSAAAFVHDARGLLDAVKARGSIPLLVGGSMFYFFMLDVCSKTPAGRNAWLQSEIDRQEEKHGLPALYRELQTLDPKRARMLHPNDAYRIKRALEICRLTKKPASAWAPTANGSGFISARFCLHYADRQKLHAEVERRLAMMLKRGFIEEVCALMVRGDLNEGLPAVRAVGYRQLWGYLKGEYGYHDMHARALAANRQLLKRQMAWLKKFSNLRRYAMDERPPAWVAEKIADAVESMIE